MIRELFTNRLGNVLAIANLSLIAINASGISAYFSLNAWMRLSFLLNVPARIASVIVLGNPFIPDGPWQTRLSHYALGTLVLVYMQWISIGWIARRIAQAIQPKQDYTTFNFQVPRRKSNVATTASTENAIVIAQKTP